MIKTLKIVKVRCHKCGYVTLIPTYGRFEVPRRVHCEDCGKVVMCARNAVP